MTFSAIIKKLKSINQPELAKSLQIAVAMERERERALGTIYNNAIPMLTQLILLVLLFQAGLPIPKTWPQEIKDFLEIISYHNKKKGKWWFTPKQIQRILDEDISGLKTLILRKADKSLKGKRKVIVKTFLPKFLLQRPKLKHMGIQLGLISGELRILISNKDKKLLI